MLEGKQKNMCLYKNSKNCKMAVSKMPKTQHGFAEIQ